MKHIVSKAPLKPKAPAYGTIDALIIETPAGKAPREVQPAPLHLAYAQGSCARKRDPARSADLRIDILAFGDDSFDYILDDMSDFDSPDADLEFLLPPESPFHD